MVREPGGTAVAERVRAVLLDPEAEIEPASELFLFLAARSDLVAKVIRPALDAGRTVLADRFELSTEAYQCGGRGIDVALFRAANHAATGGLDPDLTLVLDLPTELGFERIKHDRPAPGPDGTGGPRVSRSGCSGVSSATGPGIVHLDATLPSEQVLLTAWEEIQTRLPEARAASGD